MGGGVVSRNMQWELLHADQKGPAPSLIAWMASLWTVLCAELLCASPG